MTIRWGIIGCGDVTEVKSGPGFQNVAGSELVAVMRRDGAKAQDYARRHGVPFATSDADALIQHPEVNAVYIATPPGSHCDYALQVCAAKKPCYVEKPMARHAGECRTMNAAFASARLPLFVAYYRRALPRFLKAKELVESGALGTLTGVSYRFTGTTPSVPDPQSANTAALPWRLQAEQAGGGLFLDLGCHTLDILDFILGPLQAVQGKAANVASPCAVEDSVALCFATPSGALGTASWNFAGGGTREDRIEITGTKGCVSLSTFANEPVLFQSGTGRHEIDCPTRRTFSSPSYKPSWRI